MQKTRHRYVRFMALISLMAALTIGCQSSADPLSTFYVVETLWNRASTQITVQWDYYDANDELVSVSDTVDPGAGATLATWIRSNTRLYMYVNGVLKSDNYIETDYTRVRYYNADGTVTDTPI